MIIKSQVQDTKFFDLSYGVKNLLRQGHGIFVQASPFIHRMIIPTHVMLNLIVENIYYYYRNISPLNNFTKPLFNYSIVQA
jgi:hypothetical protein